MLASFAETWREMSLYRRILLAVLIFMIVGVGTATRIEYRGTLLYLEEEEDVRRYTGRVDGKRAEFTVTSNRMVEYCWGDYTYGPYEVVEDPSAAYEPYVTTGLEIRQADQVLFRGGIRGETWPMLYDEAGEPYGMLDITYTTSNGITYGAGGKELTERDIQEPGLTTVAKLALGRLELTTRGSFALYLLVTLLAVFNIFQICCPGIMFRWSIMWHVKDPDAAEPSEWYILMEALEWALLTGVALWLYWLALTIIN